MGPSVAQTSAGIADVRFDLPLTDLSAGRHLLRIEAGDRTGSQRRDLPFMVR